MLKRQPNSKNLGVEPINCAVLHVGERSLVPMKIDMLTEQQDNSQ